MINHKINIRYIFFYLLLFQNQSTVTAIITNAGALQMGDSMAAYCTAKLLSMQYNIPFVYAPFIHSELFALTTLETPWPQEFYANTDKFVYVRNENDVRRNLNKNVILYTDIRTLVNDVSPTEFAVIKAELRLKEIPNMQALPQGIITIGVHIRKGNGGGAHYDGEISSIQEFDFDQSQISYRTDYENFPFDWSYYQRINGHFIKDNEYTRTPADHVSGWETRFPPNQFYIDQIKKISRELGDAPLYVVICTDDRDPEQLIEKLKKAINKANVTIHYENDRHLPFRERMLRDLYILSHCDALIRPQSYFSKTAEIIGNHKLVLYPLKHRWYGNKLIMTEIVVEGQISSLAFDEKR